MIRQIVVCQLVVWLLSCSIANAQTKAVEATADKAKSNQAFVTEYCASCHGKQSPASELDLLSAVQSPIAERSAVWEHVLKKLQSHQMPPEGEPQPTSQQRADVAQAITKELDRNYFTKPLIVSSESLRRLNRSEYQNAVRDLLGVRIDAAALLPADESSYGFDNITVSDLSPAYLDRAISAAQKISHLAVGAYQQSPAGETFRVRPDITQDVHLPGLPIGTRGGTLIQTHFARPGVYEITARLTRDRNEEVEGLTEPHQLEILLDKARVKLFKVEPPPGRRDFSTVDKHLVVRTQIDQGPHSIGVTFIKKSQSLLETKRQPYNAHYNMHRHPRLGPAIYEVSITGPMVVEEESESESPVAVPRFLKGLESDQARAVAKQWLKRLLKLAYRRPITEQDLENPLKQFESVGEHDIRAGLEAAVANVLVSPHFLLKVEREPGSVKPGEAYQISDLELASRLSFFLWSSLPDEELLDLAAADRLHDRQVLESQVQRMLRDTRSQSLVDNFAEQWLYLRNLESMTPDLRAFPDFDDNLRQAFRQETKLCFEELLREDRSVLELLQSDHTYLNERLAKHYGIPHVYGSRFRRVELVPEFHRGGLLRHGSILTVTSYATRTSPVVRGHWILKNVVGAPPPPPPANVPALKDNTVASNQSMRARLAEHRAQAACAVCHNLLDPVGFSLENYDAVGRWRDSEDGMPLDVSGGLAGHEDFSGVTGLEQALLAQPDLFVSTMTERLMTFALGRPVQTQDAPAIRRIVSDAARHEYRFSQIIQAIVASPPFQMRCEP